MKQEEKEIIVDTSLREEYVSIYDKNDNLIVKSCNPLVIEDVRIQILEKELEGCYAVGENGTRCEVNIDHVSLPFQNKYVMMLDRILGIVCKHIERREREQ